jgi:hypothetical protein
MRAGETPVVPGEAILLAFGGRNMVPVYLR